MTETPKRLTPSQAQRNVKNTLQRVIEDGETIPILQADKPVAVIMPFEDYQRMLRDLAVLDAADIAADEQPRSLA